MSSIFGCCRICKSQIISQVSGTTKSPNRGRTVRRREDGSYVNDHLKKEENQVVPTVKYAKPVLPTDNVNQPTLSSPAVSGHILPQVSVSNVRRSSSRHSHRSHSRKLSNSKSRTTKLEDKIVNEKSSQSNDSHVANKIGQRENSPEKSNKICEDEIIIDAECNSSSSDSSCSGSELYKRLADESLRHQRESISIDLSGLKLEPHKRALYSACVPIPHLRWHRCHKLSLQPCHIDKTAAGDIETVKPTTPDYESDVSSDIVPLELSPSVDEDSDVPDVPIVFGEQLMMNRLARDSGGGARSGQWEEVLAPPIRLPSPRGNLPPPSPARHRSTSAGFNRKSSIRRDSVLSFISFISEMSESPGSEDLETGQDVVINGNKLHIRGRTSLKSPYDEVMGVLVERDKSQSSMRYLSASPLTPNGGKSNSPMLTPSGRKGNPILPKPPSQSNTSSKSSTGSVSPLRNYLSDNLELQRHASSVIMLQKPPASSNILRSTSASMQSETLSPILHTDTDCEIAN